MNHLTKVTISLPSLSSYSYYQESVEVGEDLVLEDGEDLVPGCACGHRTPGLDKKDTGDISVLSLVVCSTHLVAAILAVRDLGTVALCRPGAAAWSVSAHIGCWCLSHMVFFQGKLYTFKNTSDFDQHLIAIDIVDKDTDEPRLTRIEHLILGAYSPSQKYYSYMHYLVESHGTLLMIRRKFSYKRQLGTLVACSIKLEVFEADFEQCLWAKGRTLGDSQALFLGQEYCRAVHVSPYDVSRDCVFFLDDCPNRLVKHTTDACGVYDMKDEKVYSPLPLVSWKSKEVPATWIFS